MLDFLKNLAGPEVTITVVNVVIMVVLGVMIALIFFAVRGILRYFIEMRTIRRARRARLESEQARLRR